MERTLGPWRLVRRLGSGGMGEVYEAEHVQGGQRCALKLLPQANPAEALRFAREGRSLAAAGRHPHVVEVLQLGSEGGVAFLALELVEGGDLEGVIAERGPRSPAEACRLTREAALGIAHMHQRGVLHRDLKPANVLLTRAGAAKVTDFGLARLSGAETLTQSGEVLGTPVYMAPEQAKGEVEGYGPWTDVYGLGGLLYACLTGRPPITSRGSVLATLDAVLVEQPTRPSTFNRAVPRWLDEACLRALAKDPGERFSGALELAEALHDPGQPTERRRPSSWVVVPAALLAAGALGFALASRGEPPPRTSQASASPLSSPGPSPGPSLGPTPPGSASPRASALVARARGLRERGGRASAGDLVSAWEAALAAAEGDADLQEACLLELVRVSHRRHVIHPLRRAARELQRRGVHVGEATYRLGDALASGSRWEEGRAALQELAGLSEPWATLGAARSALEGPLDDETTASLFERLRATREATPSAEARRLLARLEVLLAATANPFGGVREWGVHRQLVRDDVQELLFGVALLARDSRGEEKARSLLAEIRRISAPTSPLGELEECELRLRIAAGEADAALLERASQSKSLLSPWRATTLLLRLGNELYDAAGPRVAVQAWRQIDPRFVRALLRNWEEHCQRRSDQDPFGTLARRAYGLRLGRVLGEPAEVEVGPEARREIQAWVERLEPPQRAAGQRVLSAAASGATWQSLAGEVAELSRGGPQARLLALEVALGRDQRRFAIQLAASFGPSVAPELRERAALTLLVLGLVRLVEGLESSQPAKALLRAHSAFSRGDLAAAERELAAARDGPPWCLRLSAFLASELGAEQRRPAAAREPWTSALYGRQHFNACLARDWNRGEVWDDLAQAIRALRVTESPLLLRLLLCELTLTLPEPYPRGLSGSRALWLEEARALQEDLAWRRFRGRIHYRMRLVEGLELAARGAPAARVRAKWQEALRGEGELSAKHREIFAERYGEPF